jgi:hypothetical protein
MPTVMRDPRQEAAARVASPPDRNSVRVLEPAPPAVVRPPWYADDPLAPGGKVAPVDRPRSTSWHDLCQQRGDTALIAFCTERWLGPWRRLEALPPEFAATREALHAVAEHVVCTIREAATGKIGLRWTLGGFGTPFLPGNRQVRVERTDLVDGDRRHPLTTIGRAAAFAGTAPGAPDVYAAATPLEPDAALMLAPDAASRVADWFGFTTSVVEQVRAEADAGERPARVQLWPEHFDLAVEMGADGRRATFGGSPGDAAHAEPYLYIGPWEQRHGEFWNEPFGASLPYAALLGAVNQREVALAFLRAGRDLLRAGA